MATQEETDQLRAKVLRALYEATGGETGERVEIERLAEASGITNELAERTADYLVQRRLAEWRTFGPTIGITVRGADQVERWNRERERKPADAPRQRTPVAPVLTGVEVQRVEAALTALDREDIASHLEGDDLAEFEADRATVDSQLRSPRPKRAIIAAGLKALATQAMAFGNGVAAGLLAGAIAS